MYIRGGQKGEEGKGRGESRLGLRRCSCSIYLLAWHGILASGVEYIVICIFIYLFALGVFLQT